LFARPANVLVLDEPTNDLDIDTLELLEDLIQDYAGTVFIVSHDRAFINNVVTSTLVFEGDGHWREYEGDIQDWLTQSARTRALASAAPPTPVPASTPAPTEPLPAPKKATAKLSYKEQRELESLPRTIEALEEEQRSLREALSDPQIYIRDPQQAATLHARDAEIDDALLACLERWEALSAR
jgi:ATP-binding cassette subfamily F protein uup